MPARCLCLLCLFFPRRSSRDCEDLGCRRGRSTNLPPSWSAPPEGPLIDDSARLSATVAPVVSMRGARSPRAIMMGASTRKFTAGCPAPRWSPRARPVNPPTPNIAASIQAGARVRNSVPRMRELRARTWPRASESRDRTCPRACSNIRRCLARKCHGSVCRAIDSCAKV